MSQSSIFRLGLVGLFIASGAVLLSIGLANDKQIAKEKESAEPVCCMKNAYCCVVKAKCCKSGETTEAEIIPLSFVKEDAAKPPCCDKRAYCCTLKAACCGKTTLIEISALNDKTPTANEAPEPICCAKRAYCCIVKSTCCGKTSTENLVAKDVDKATREAFAADRDKSAPPCCMKNAYCCTLKMPCCGKEMDIEVIR